jgi:hypothetical protein
MRAGVTFGWYSDVSKCWLFHNNKRLGFDESWGRAPPVGSDVCCLDPAAALRLCPCVAPVVVAYKPIVWLEGHFWRCLGTAGVEYQEYVCTYVFLFRQEFHDMILTTNSSYSHMGVSVLVSKQC